MRIAISTDSGKVAMHFGRCPQFTIVDIEEKKVIRKEVIENYIEYDIAMMQDFKEQGKSLDNYIDHMKTILWFIKDQRAQQIKTELGL